ncbi:MAG: hypothetical protein HGA19_17870 [Oscillochloris sp.]|nr:hypothetical protein [Oscillochloris sp.]
MQDDISMQQPADSEVFDYRASKDGQVFVRWHGRTVTTLKGKAAERFLARVSATDAAGVQLEMARVTGNFRRGNERLAKSKSRE